MVGSLSHKNKGLLASLLIGLSVFLIMLLIGALDLFPALKLSSYDLLFSWRVNRIPTSAVVIVSIDDKSFEEMGSYPWSRDVYGKIIEKINADKPKVICFDVEFANPSPIPVNDMLFSQAAKKAGNVIAVTTFTNDKIAVEGVGEFPYKKYNLPIKLLAASFLKTGFTALDMDGDGVVRKSSLVAFLDDEKALPTLDYSKTQRVYSFALTAASIYLDKTEEEMVADVSMHNPGYKKGTRLTDNSLMVNYEGAPNTFKKVSFYRVMNGDVSKGTFKDKIVLIGATSTVLHDEFLTPYKEAGNMPGVEIHANVIDDLLKKEYLTKSNFWLNCLIMVIFIAAVIFFTSRFGPFLSSGLTLLLFILFFFVALYSFINNYWIDISNPFFALTLAYITNVAYRTIVEQKKSKRTKTLFQRFVSRQVVEELLKQGSDQVSLGGKKQHITVFFSDIRNFTTMSERLPPEEVVEVLNFYFKEMTNIAFKYGGTVDKYIGDAIMVEFGAPLPRINDEELCVRMAIEMQEKMKELREFWKNQKKEPFEIGCGINAGEAVIGFMGTEKKMEYSALGDTVNIASRLESLTKEYHASIIISESVYEKVKDIVLVKDLGFASVKGKTVKVRIYDVLGLKKA